jgi:hypothetical protein
MTKIYGIDGKEIKSEQVKEKQEAVSNTKEFISTLGDLNPVTLVAIGIAADGQFFVMDTEKAIKNTNFMIDYAKSSLFMQMHMEQIARAQGILQEEEEESQQQEQQMDLPLEEEEKPVE